MLDKSWLPQGCLCSAWHGCGSCEREVHASFTADRVVGFIADRGAVLLPYRIWAT